MADGDLKVASKRPSFPRREEEAFGRVISRNTSFGGSSRMYFNFGSKEGVPFKWEMKPGTPRDPPEQEHIPPISPSPAMLSLGLPKPLIQAKDQPSCKPPRFTLKLLKKLHRKALSMYRPGNYSTDDKGFKNRNKVESSCGSRSARFMDFDACSSDDEEIFVASSTRNSSSSSCSTSSSLPFHGVNSKGSTLEQRGRSEDSRRKFQGCEPWNPWVLIWTRRKERLE